MKKHLFRLICTTVTASILIGCGAKDAMAPSDNIMNEVVIENTKATDETKEAQNSRPDELSMNEPSKEIAQETPAPVEEKELLLSIISAGAEHTYTACDEHGTEYDLTLAETFPEEDKQYLAIGSVSILHITVEEESSGPLNVTAATDIEEGTDTSAIEKIAFEKIHGFSVDNTFTATRFAKQAVNVRSGPSTDYEKIGGLAFAQEVHVTGVANTGWYQIKLQDQIGYVSDKYLITEKPVAQAATVAAQSKDTVQASEATDFYAVYSEAEMNEALAKGDLVNYFNMLNANSAATMGGESSGGSGEASEPTLATQKFTSLSADFVNYMNQKRVEADLSELSWSESMESTALERAEEITNDFSHNGVRNCNAENIAQMTTADVGSWFDAFNNSSTHRQNMMDSTYKSAAAAVCQIGNSYYVVVLFGF